MNYKYLWMAVGFLFLWSGCLKDRCTETRTFVRWDPVYKSEEALKAPIRNESPHNLENPGIIYFYKNYILVNEFRRGIHVIDNQDPENPVNVNFISIEGNEHFAVYKNQLQANKFNSLITIDISNPLAAEEVFRQENVFNNIWEDPSRGFLVYYRQTEQQVILDCSDPNFNSARWENGVGGPIFVDVLFNSVAERDFASASAGSGNSGVGGSTARFTIASEYLYTVSEYDLKVFDMEDPARPSLVNTVNIGWGIETIYPFKGTLFIGSNSGMFIYDISSPTSPRFVSSFSHATACDPVVANENTAYVTLRDGSACQGFNNQLDIIDITMLSEPRLIRSYGMENPHGLAIQKGSESNQSAELLYLCEGDYGFKVYDVSDPKNMIQLAHDKHIKALDVIALDKNHLLIIGEEGLIQYDARNPNSLIRLSIIPAVNPI